eukprot:11831875-Ditylum_brightwellii.AAC.1
MGKTWTLQHIKGYQNGPDISWEAKLNNIADILATEAHAWITPAMATCVQFQYHAAKICLTINDNTITCSFPQEIQQAYMFHLI